MYDVETFIAYALAVVLAVYCFRQLDTALRIAAVQVCCAFLVEVTGMLLPNVWLFNLYLVLDCALLLTLVVVDSRRKLVTLSASLGFAAFVIVWLYDIVVYGWQNFAGNSYIVDSVLLMAFYLYLLYQSILPDERRLYYSSRFWLCLAIIIFYGSNLPSLPINRFLNKELQTWQCDVIWSILGHTVFIRYTLMALCFFTFVRFPVRHLTAKK